MSKLVLKWSLIIIFIACRDEIGNCTRSVFLVENKRTMKKMKIFSTKSTGIFEM